MRRSYIHEMALQDAIKDMRYLEGLADRRETPVADQRPIPTLGDAQLDELTQIRVRTAQRIEQHARIVYEASRLLEEGRMILLEFANPHEPPARDLLWDIEGRMQVLVDALLALWAEEMEGRALEGQIWIHLG
ncbi:hypothetical protein N7501_004139 [Penicillium viridicatum]|nr:hypothetical protein N7501_004139 [Penicillium viridicatum]